MFIVKVTQPLKVNLEFCQLDLGLPSRSIAKRSFLTERMQKNISFKFLLILWPLIIAHHLTHSDPPKVSYQSDQFQGGGGVPLVLGCLVHGEPAPSVNWFRLAENE